MKEASPLTLMTESHQSLLHLLNEEKEHPKYTNYDLSANDYKIRSYYFTGSQIL